MVGLAKSTSPRGIRNQECNSGAIHLPVVIGFTGEGKGGKGGKGKICLYHTLGKGKGSLPTKW